jgi:hypothetical protein
MVGSLWLLRRRQQTVTIAGAARDACDLTVATTPSPGRAAPNVARVRSSERPRSGPGNEPRRPPRGIFLDQFPGWVCRRERQNIRGPTRACPPHTSNGGSRPSCSACSRASAHSSHCAAIKMSWSRMRMVVKLSASVRNTLACSRSCSTCVIGPDCPPHASGFERL